MAGRGPAGGAGAREGRRLACEMAARPKAGRGALRRLAQGGKTARFAFLAAPGALVGGLVRPGNATRTQRCPRAGSGAWEWPQVRPRALRDAGGSIAGRTAARGVDLGRKEHVQKQGKAVRAACTSRQNRQGRHRARAARVFTRRNTKRDQKRGNMPRITARSGRGAGERCSARGAAWRTPRVPGARSTSGPARLRLWERTALLWGGQRSSTANAPIVFVR